MPLQLGRGRSPHPCPAEQHCSWCGCPVGLLGLLGLPGALWRVRLVGLPRLLLVSCLGLGSSGPYRPRGCKLSVGFPKSHRLPAAPSNHSRLQAGRRSGVPYWRGR